MRDRYTSTSPVTTRHGPLNRLSNDFLGLTSHSPRTTTAGPGGLEGPGPLLTPSRNASFSMPTAPMQLDHNAAGPVGMTAGSAGPPLLATVVHHQLTAADGRPIQPDVLARIDKGFFLYDSNWTCYRRNYFSIACGYRLKPSQTSLPIYVKRNDILGGTARITAFAMSISAIVDDSAGKPVELIQHTPKRDKGPQHTPDRIRLAPYPDDSLGMFSGALAAGRIHHEYDPAPTAGAAAVVSSAGGESPTMTQFERIQFKSATANNGKRRAAQQYYRLVVDLFADVGTSFGTEGRWIKVAERSSAPVVVRGRSPGHYQDDRRGNASNMSPHGSTATDVIHGGGGGGGDGSGRADSFSGSGHHHHHHHQVMSALGEPLSVSVLGRQGGGGGHEGDAFSGRYHAPGDAFASWTGPALLCPDRSLNLLPRRRSGSCSSDSRTPDLERYNTTTEEQAYHQPYPLPPFEPAPSYSSSSTKCSSPLCTRSQSWMELNDQGRGNVPELGAFGEDRPCSTYLSILSPLSRKLEWDSRSGTTTTSFVEALPLPPAVDDIYTR